VRQVLSVLREACHPGATGLDVLITDHGIPALPLHDGLMVAASKAKKAEEVMDRPARELTGLTIPVKVSMLPSAPTPTRARTDIARAIYYGYSTGADGWTGW
jgi:hypothetical protein